MNTKLITALRTTANALEQGTFHYVWTQTSSCNCGSLFCALTGKSAKDLDSRVPETIDGSKPTWKKLVGQYCPITGMPEQELFKELFGYGLTQADIVNLEFLRDPAVIARIPQAEIAPPLSWGFVKQKASLPDYQNKAHVILYMRAWADLLTEQGAMDVVAPSPSPSPVEATT